MSKALKIQAASTLLIAALCASSSHAGPIIAGGELNFRTSAAITWTDRVLPSAGASDDIFYTVTPALIYNREVGLSNVNAQLAFPFTRYDTFDILDSNSLSAGFNSRLPFAPANRFSGTWSLSYFDGAQEDLYRNDVSQNENFSARLRTNYRVGSRISLRSTIGYQDQTRESLTTGTLVNAYETDEFGLGLQVHEVLGRIGFYTDYRIRTRTTTGNAINRGINDKDEGINFGITGQILPERLFPKLEADLSFSLNSNKQLEGRGRDGDRLSFQGSLAYPATTKINVSLNFSRSLALTTLDNTAEVTSVQLAAQYAMSNRLQFSTAIGTNKRDYLDAVVDRSDDSINLSGSAVYRLNNRMALNGSIMYSDRDSNRLISDYSRTIVSLSSSITF